MPTRPFSIARISDFLGLSDGLAIQASDQQGSVVENWLKKRRSLVRRPGYALVGEATLSIDPLTLNGLELYLRSDQVSGTDGSAVSTWNDISGHARHASQATAARKPLLRLTGSMISPNGTRMIDFDGVDDEMDGVLPGGGSISIASGLTIYVYCKEGSLTTGGFNAQQVFSCGNSVSVFEMYTRTSAALGVGFADQQYGVNSGNARANHGATALGYQLLTLQFLPPAGASASWKYYSDGVQLGSAGTNWQATDIRTSYQVGNTGAFNEGFQGSIGAVLVFSEAHDDTTRMGVESFLTDFFE